MTKKKSNIISDNLMKKGIKCITDNLKPGQAIQLPKGLLFEFFGDEIIQELNKRHITNKS